MRSAYLVPALLLATAVCEPARAMDRELLGILEAGCQVQRQESLTQFRQLDKELAALERADAALGEEAGRVLHEAADKFRPEAQRLGKMISDRTKKIAADYGKAAEELQASDLNKEVKQRLLETLADETRKRLAASLSNDFKQEVSEPFRTPDGTATIANLKGIKIQIGKNLSDPSQGLLTISNRESQLVGEENKKILSLDLQYDPLKNSYRGVPSGPTEDASAVIFRYDPSSRESASAPRSKDQASVLHGSSAERIQSLRKAKGQLGADIKLFEQECAKLGQKFGEQSPARIESRVPAYVKRMELGDGGSGDDAHTEMNFPNSTGAQ